MCNPDFNPDDFDSMSNERLIVEFPTCDRAFAVLEKRLHPKLMGWLLHGGMSWHSAEDIAQDTLIDLLKKIDKYDPNEGLVEAFVWRIAICNMYDRFRKESSEARKVDKALQQGAFDKGDNAYDLHFWITLAAAIEKVRAQWRVQYGADSIQICTVDVTLEFIVVTPGSRIPRGKISALLKSKFPDEKSYPESQRLIVECFFTEVRRILSDD